MKKAFQIKIKASKIRNPYAVTANSRKAGRHKNKKKEAARKCCRHGVSYER